jgi:hypothetical protein
MTSKGEDLGSSRLKALGVDKPEPSSVMFALGEAVASRPLRETCSVVPWPIPRVGVMLIEQEGV